MTDQGVPDEHAEAAKTLRKKDFEVESALGRGGVVVVCGLARDGEKLAMKVAAPWAKADPARGCDTHPRAPSKPPPSLPRSPR